ncbi:phosphate ABC transporter permease PstA [Nocardioides rubriscoriae]|uniref:phosphate ABC transporter permease PstA n=1 Tax=Nocardioides rubriscoriae TaxID=642762 RepID=UPI0011DF254E|nr:phosphate ABC transporter permease PstA [Nocardioides rubriscoriae]
MTSLDQPTRTSSDRVATSMVSARLPQRAPLMVAGIAVAVGALCLLLGLGLVPAVLIGALVYLVALPVWSLSIEGRRTATDRMMTGLIWATFAIALAPLISLVWQVIARGVPAINSTFLTYSGFKTSLDAPTGVYHAIIGTLIITAGAAIISVPIGIMTAVYLIEYGKKNSFARTVTFLVDVMTGIPSIVAGLFAFAMFTLLFGPGYKSAIGGSVALSLLMVPTVVRATEEMLRLVPDDLREASYALGTPKWRTITKVVLPTAIGGIITGVTLAISRVIGETAPLLLIAGATDITNTNPFSGDMTTLPVLIFGKRTSAGNEDIIWGAALVLIVIVMLLNLVARVLGKVLSPKQG